MKILYYLLTLLFFTSNLYSYSLSGKIIDLENGAPLGNITIGIDELYYFTKTNDMGEFIFKNIEPGFYVLKTANPLYGEKTLDIKLKRDFYIEIELKKVIFTLKGIKNYSVIKDDRIGTYIITHDDIKDIPSGAGNSFHALQTLPGVGSSFLLSSVPIIRGNNPIYNKYYIDDIPIDYPYHYFGSIIPLISSVNEEIIDKIRVINTPYPLRYNDSISSIIDIKTREPETYGVTGKFILNPIVPLFPAIYVTATPTADINIIFLGKRTDVDLYNNLALRESNNDFYSQEHYLKITYNLDTHSRFYFISFGSDDFMSIKNRSMGFNEMTARSMYHVEALKWEFLLSNRLFFKTIFSNYQIDHKIKNVIEKDKSTTIIAYDPYQYRLFQELFYSSKHVTINAGYEYTTHGGGAKGNVNLGTIAGSNGFSIDPALAQTNVILNTPIKGSSISFFSDGTLNFKPLWLNIGARYKNYGPDSNELFSYRGLLGFNITGSTALYMGGGSYYSHPDMYYYLGQINPDFKESRSYNSVLGFKAAMNNLLSGQLELYYTRYKNLYSLENTKQSDQLAALSQISPFSIESDGTSYGSELYLIAHYRMIEGRLSYTYSVSKRNHNEINAKNYYADFDQRHIFRTIIITKVDNWVFSSAWYFFSSFPYTPVTGSASSNSKFEPQYGEHNSKRYDILPRQEYKLSYNFKSGSRFYINTAINPKYYIYQKYDKSKPYGENNPEFKKDIPLFLWIGLELCF